MTLLQIKKTKWLYTALAFCIPLAGLLLLRLICTLFFNGVYSMLYSDQYHQYYPFFLEFRRTLLSGDSLLHNWSVGMGMDYLGLVSYYLASPLNLLCVLIPENLCLAYFSLLMPLKLGFASMFFAIFLKNTFVKNDISISLFGCFYALCAWALGYQWNIMWLDTFALLPLVALGAVKLLKERKFVLYTLSLFLSVLSNYYIGFFTCIFVLLLFICYQICRFSTFERFFNDLLLIAAFSILAIAMTAFLELPAFAALQSTQSSVNQFPEGFRLNIATTNDWKGLFIAMGKIAGNMNGGLEPTFKEGLPNLYCGICTNILAFLFITCRRIKFRDKICCVVLLLFFNVSFIIRQLDYIWHGFHFTNMIPYRFSFLYSFVMLYMAYRAWLMRRSFRLWQIITSAVLSITLLFLCSGMEDILDLFNGNISLAPVTSTSNLFYNIKTIAVSCRFLIYSGLLLIIYLATMSYAFCWRKPSKTSTLAKRHALLNKIRSRRKLGTTLICYTMVLELIMNVVNFGISFPGTNIADYPRGKEDTEKVLSYMYEQEEGNLFFRAETAHSQTLNDGALNGYNGVSTFTSSANVNVTYFMQALGYGAKNTYNRYCFEESSPVANLFLNLKYMIDRDGNVADSNHFTQVYQSGNVRLLENQSYLPLGFLANNQLVNMDFRMQGGRFEFQNQLLQAASGISENVWQPIDSNNLSITGQDVTLNSQMQSGYSSYTTKASTSGTVEYSYTADREGFMCIALDLSKRNSYTVYLNGEQLYSETYSLPQMLAVSHVTPGDVVQIKLNCKSGETGTIYVSAAILNEQIYNKAYEILSKSTLELTHFSNTRVEGTIHCDRNGVLYTSIPQNGNWTVLVDGKPTQIALIGNAMCGVFLEEGKHTVTFQYQNDAYELGWKISLGAAVIFMITYIAVYRPKFTRKKGKYEQYKGDA